MCGIIGVVSRKREVLPEAIILLNSENNRGEQACGVATFNGSRTSWYCDEGLVREVFHLRNKKKWAKLRGSACIAHTLYSTVGRGGEDKQPKILQPIIFSFRGCRGAIALNGNLIRLDGLRKEAQRAGYSFKSEVSDIEVIAALLSISQKPDFLEALLEVLKKIEGKGAFSLVILFKDKVIGVKDEHGIRPLCFGKKNDPEGDSYILASETSVFPALASSRFIREVEPGEVIVLGSEGIEKSFRWTSKTRRRLCVCELIYLANPATEFWGRSVYSFRVEAGKIAALKHPAPVDVIVSVPNAGNNYGDGFALKSKIPRLEGIIRSNYSLRTFMAPRDQDRSMNQRAKLQVLSDVMAGKSICLVEDSVFRASVAKPIVSFSRIHGKAVEVHLRICSPPVRHRCHLGLDTATKKELIALGRTEKEVGDIIQCDSLEYLTVEELKEALLGVGLDPNNFCLGCFTGEYPVPPPEE